MDFKLSLDASHKIGSRTINFLYLVLVMGLVVIISFALGNDFIIRPLENAPFFSLYIGVVLLLSYAILKTVACPKCIKITVIDILWLVFYVYRLWHTYYLSGSLYSRTFLEFTLLALLYLVFRAIDKHYQPILFYALLVAVLFQGIYGQLQLYGVYSSHHSLFNITGSFFNPAPYAGYLCCAFPIALLFYFKKKRVEDSTLWKTIINRIPYLLALFCTVAIVIVLPATRSRAAWVSTFFIALIIILRYTTSGRKLLPNLKVGTLKRNFLIVGIALFFIISLLGLYYLKKDSADGRLLIAQIATEMVREKPLLGLGENGFEAHYMMHQADFFTQHPDHSGLLLADNIQYAYNEVLKLVVEYGILGLLLAAMIAYAIIRIKKKSVMLRAAQYGLLGLFIFSLFSYPSAIIAIKVNVVLFLAISSTYSSALSSVNRRVSRSVAMVLFVGLVFLLPKANAKIRTYYAALVSWNDASDIYRIEAYEECLDDFALAYPCLQRNGDFLIQYGKALSMAKQDIVAAEMLESAKPYLNNTILYTALGDSYTRLSEYDKAEEAYFQAYNMVPNRFYPLYLLALMYEQSGQNDKALAMVATIDQKTIKIDSKAITEIKTEMQNLQERLTPE